MGDPRTSSTWFLTPFNAGTKKLPSFESGDGLDRLLEVVPEIHLTSLGRRPAAKPPSTRRAAFAKAQSMLKPTTRRAIQFSKPATSTLGTAWLAASFTPAGTLSREVRRGPTAFTVTRS
jgi:hypothetical protein